MARNLHTCPHSWPEEPSKEPDWCHTCTSYQWAHYTDTRRYVQSNSFYLPCVTCTYKHTHLLTHMHVSAHNTYRYWQEVTLSSRKRTLTRPEQPLPLSSTVSHAPLSEESATVLELVVMETILLLQDRSIWVGHIIQIYAQECLVMQYTHYIHRATYMYAPPPSAPL